MDTERMISEMTFEEKARILSGASNMETYAIEWLGIRALCFADGPHGIREEIERADRTYFPNLCNLGSSWDVESACEMGRALADECRHYGIDMLLGPGLNMKRYILCGRNFEYFSEDPVLTGILAAGYIRGLQSGGVSACPKHFAVNNQEQDREWASFEVDERTLREIYLKAFEIAVKDAQPDAVMCGYNKVNGIWCSENEYLLQTILKDEWGFDGIAVSDWGAVHNASRAVRAGLDLQMPLNAKIVEQLRQGLEQGLVSEDEIDRAVKRVLGFVLRAPQAKPDDYDREKQHAIARKIASRGIVLLKNDDHVLPITPEKYKKVAVVGEFAVSPLIGGQGSAEVYPDRKYVESPLEELQKLLPEIEFRYFEAYQKSAFSDTMIWPSHGKVWKSAADCDLVLVFVGAMESEDTEKYDRRTAKLNPNYEGYIELAIRMGKKVAVILQNGGAMILDPRCQRAGAIVEAWLGGEAAGGAIADVLCGAVNPSGKLAETFPTKMRADLDYPGDGLKLEYKERFEIGYRYYDKHPEEILYPFGHGLSYTEFCYRDLDVRVDGAKIELSFTLENTGECAGEEVVQLYVGDPVSTVVKPSKELKRFQKVFLEKGAAKRVEFTLDESDLSYYNPMMRAWVVESGVYDLYLGSSSRDIRLKKSVRYTENCPYTIDLKYEPKID